MIVKQLDGSHTPITPVEAWALLGLILIGD
jgi:hypothetical protein